MTSPNFDMTEKKVLNSAFSYLVIGGDGAIGSACYRLLKSKGARVITTTRRVDRVGPDRRFLDLGSDLSKWRPPVSGAIAIFCAAETSIAACEENPRRAYLINVENVVAVARRLLDAGCFVVFPSSNAVFDGTRPFMPVDAKPTPTVEYGRQKAEAEKRLMGLDGHVAIVRLTKVIGANISPFREWLQVLAARGRIQAYTDLMMAPVPLEIAIQVLVGVGEKGKTGVFQVSGADDVSHAKAAGQLAQRMGSRQELVMEISSTEASAGPLYKPRHTTLDMGTTSQFFGIMPPDLNTALVQLLAEKGRLCHAQDDSA